MKTWICIIAGLCLFSGCRNPSYTAATRSAFFVGPKPIVGFVPVFDNAKHRLPWNVSQELTANIQHCLLQHDMLYLIDQERMSQAFKNLQADQNPFGEEINWIRKKFRNEEFVAFVELVNHDEIPLNFREETPVCECAAELYLSARIRVFDLRGAAPKIVLSEIITHSENIPQQFTRINLAPIPPDQEDFSMSPQGIAHDLFAKEIAERIEDYVLLAL